MSKKCLRYCENGQQEASAMMMLNEPQSIEIAEHTVTSSFKKENDEECYPEIMTEQCARHSMTPIDV